MQASFPPHRGLFGNPPHRAAYKTIARLLRRSDVIYIKGRPSAFAHYLYTNVQYHSADLRRGRAEPDGYAAGWDAKARRAGCLVVPSAEMPPPLTRQ